MNTSPWRFLFVVAGPRAGSIVVALLVIAFGIYLAWTYPGGFDQAVAIALFLQMFASSTGYRDRLRRGHFDPILAGGSSAWRIAAAHWTASIGLGLAAWTMLGILDLLAWRDHWPTPFSAAGLAVLLYVSTAAWAASVAIGRYGGAVAWLLILFTMASTQHLQGLRQMFNPAAEAWSDMLPTMAGVLVCPIFLMIDPPRAGARVLALTVGATLVAWAIGACVIARCEAALQDT